MSRIGNRAIEAKLREVLEGQEGVELGRFEEATALALIFAHYDDRLSFADIVHAQNLQEIAQLKVAEMQLRTQLDYYMKMVQQQEAPEAQEDLSEEGACGRCEELLRVCAEKEAARAKYEHDNELLERKIFDSTNLTDSLQNEIVLLNAQLEADTRNLQEAQAKIQQLRAEREDTAAEHEEALRKYRQDFVDDLLRTLKQQHSQELQDQQAVTRALQKELKDQQELVKEAVRLVNKTFWLQEPADLGEGLRKWLSALEGETRKYVEELAAAGVEAEESPARQFVTHQKQRIEGRRIVLSRYLSK